jgi:hypothetical protein
MGRHTGVPLSFIICPRSSSSSAGNGKRRWDLNAVFAKPEVYRMATGLNQLLVPASRAFINDNVALTTRSYTPQAAYSGK